MLSSLPWAPAVFIAAYTVVDGIGVRISGIPIAYTGWRSLICTVLMLLLYYRSYRRFRLNLFERETQKAVAAAIIAMLGYAVIVWAMTTNRMGAVSALRETSVVFATLIGVVFLKERLSFRRIAACVVIVIGAVLLQ